jgi:predicted metal-dependent HD superfamily phosphohydrolase
MVDLDEHWPRLMAGCANLRRRLVEAYAAPGRRYHDTRHLAEVLDHLAHLLPRTSLSQAEGDVVVLAAWFHDAVYDARPDDEERSAALAEGTLPSCAVPPRVVAEVARLVRVTRDHDPGPDDLAGQLLCDADLAILAADPARYAEYVRGVREEYSRVGDAAFREGRAAVLRALAQGPLFHTPAAREAWEARARANLERELAGLSTPPRPS